MIPFIKRLFPAKAKRNFKEKLGVPSLHWSLQNIKKIGFNPLFVIDGGAYEGYWTKDFLEVFPKASVLMLEAQESKRAILQNVCSMNNQVKYHIGLLSGEDGKTYFFAEEETNSHISERDSGEKKIQLQSQTLDSIIAKGGYPLPDFIKLDLQGFELEVLKGASNCLNAAEFCLLEVSLLDLAGGTPLILELLNFMNAKGFQAYDICQFIRRPYDKALWQIDLLCIKSDSRFIAEKRWN